MLHKLAQKVDHYALAIQKRAFLISEYYELRRTHDSLPSAWLSQIIKNPTNLEDRLNLLRFLNPSDPHLLVDIGANTGYWSQEFVDLFRKTRVEAFEPDPRAYPAYVERFRHNEKVRVHQTALSSHEGTASFTLGADTTFSTLETYSSTQAGRQIELEDTVDVRISTLDSFAIQKRSGEIAVLKLDVQGHECKVLEGAKSTLPMFDLVIAELSFADEYNDEPPSFAETTAVLRAAGLYPIIFQSHGRDLSPFAWERDVIFVKRALLDSIWNKR